MHHLSHLLCYLVSPPCVGMNMNPNKIMSDKTPTTPRIFQSKLNCISEIIPEIIYFPLNIYVQEE